MSRPAADFVVIGARVVGLALARESRQHYPVGSLKGRLCAKAAATWAEFCHEKGVPAQRLGNVVLSPSGRRCAPMKFQPVIDLKTAKASRCCDSRPDPEQCGDRSPPGDA